MFRLLDCSRKKFKNTSLALSSTVGLIQVAAEIKDRFTRCLIANSRFLHDRVLRKYPSTNIVILNIENIMRLRCLFVASKPSNFNLRVLNSNLIVAIAVQSFSLFLNLRRLRLASVYSNLNFLIKSCLIVQNWLNLSF